MEGRLKTEREIEKLLGCILNPIQTIESKSTAETTNINTINNNIYIHTSANGHGPSITIE
jgi:hypothetical protein